MCLDSESKNRKGDVIHSNQATRVAIHLPNHAPRNVPVLLALEDMWGSNLFLCKLRFCFACFSSGHNGVIIESDQLTT